jgi:oligoribonuclease (3'-5' exoribonuclease)
MSDYAHDQTEKLIEEAEKRIQDLEAELAVVKNENKSLQMQVDGFNQMIDDIEKLDHERRELIAQAKEIKDKYQKAVEEILLLKKKYSQQMQAVLNGKKIKGVDK